MTDQPDERRELDEYFCPATADSGCGPDVPLRCDYRRGHGGARHAERGVASWARDGSDVRWFVGSKGGRDVYRAEVGEVASGA